MSFLRLYLRLCAPLMACALLGCLVALGQEAPTTEAAPVPALATTPEAQPSAPIIRQAPEALSRYDPALFEKRPDPTQLSALKTYAGASSGDLFQDRQFRKLMKIFVPDCLFHYGRDMPLGDSLDMALSNSHDPVQLRDGRYLTLSGSRGPYLGGRAFLWLDLQDGIGLGAFFFHPVNGEPTPTLAVFSRQVRSEFLAMSDLPPAFAQDLAQWSADARVPEITTRYFLTGTNKRVLLEHDENFCKLADGTIAPSGSGCEQLNADAADIDETAAYYLAQVHYATNATAWMIGSDQVAWIGVRDRTCGGVVDPLGCRIRITREHTHVILRRPPPHPIPGPRR